MMSGKQSISASKNPKGKKRSRITHDPALIMQAIESVKSKKYTVNKAAKVFKIPRSTLQDKLSGKVPIEPTFRGLLSREEERKLVDYIVLKLKSGSEVTHCHVKAKAKEFVDQRQDSDKEVHLPSHSWLLKFLGRHPILKNLNDGIPEAINSTTCGEADIDDICCLTTTVINSPTTTEAIRPSLSIKKCLHCGNGKGSLSKAPKGKRIRKIHDPALIMQAIESVKSKKYTINKAAKVFKIPRSTLQDKFSGKVPIEREFRGFLSLEEERKLVDYIVFKFKSGFEVTYCHIKAKAKEFVDQRQDSDKEVHLPSNMWLKCFFGRHPILKNLNDGIPEAINSTTCGEAEIDEICPKTYDQSEDDLGTPTTSTKTARSPLSTANTCCLTTTIINSPTTTEAIHPSLPLNKCLHSGNGKVSISKAHKEKCNRKIHHPALLLQAIKSIKTKKYTIGKAAQAFKVPKSTLTDKLSRKVLIERGYRGFLSREEERELEEYIMFKSKRGFNVTSHDIRATAKEIVNQRQVRAKEINLPSLKWLHCFFRRHPVLKKLKHGTPEAYNTTTCVKTPVDEVPDDIMCPKTCDESENEIGIATTSAKTETLFPSALDEILIPFNTAESINTETLFPSTLKESVIAFNSAESISQFTTNEKNQAFTANETKRTSSVNETNQSSTTILCHASTATMQTPTSNKNVHVFTLAADNCCPTTTTTISHPISTATICHPTSTTRIINSPSTTETISPSISGKPKAFFMMSAKKSGKRNKNYHDPALILQAIESIETKGYTRRKAAKVFKISHSALVYNLRKFPLEPHLSRYLSSVEERKLVDYFMLHVKSKSSFKMMNCDIRAKAKEIADQREDSDKEANLPSLTWVYSLFKRHPELKKLKDGIPKAICPSTSVKRRLYSTKHKPYLFMSRKYFIKPKLPKEKPIKIIRDPTPIVQERAIGIGSKIKSYISQEEEKQLVDYIVFKAKYGFHTTGGELRTKVKQIADQRQDSEKKHNLPTYYWLHCFFNRHPELKNLKYGTPEAFDSTYGGTELDEIPENICPITCDESEEEEIGVPTTSAETETMFPSTSEESVVAFNSVKSISQSTTNEMKHSATVDETQNSSTANIINQSFTAGGIKRTSTSTANETNQLSSVNQTNQPSTASAPICRHLSTAINNTSTFSERVHVFNLPARARTSSSTSSISSPVSTASIHHTTSAKTKTMKNIVCTATIRRPNSSEIISNPITNSPKIISNPISNSPKIISNPISNSPKIISNPISNSPKIISNSISNSPKIISNPISNSSKIISNPISNSSKIISNPITNSSKIISNPISNSSKIINNPISNSTKIISNPISNSTKIISNPISNSPKIISNSISNSPKIISNPISNSTKIISNPISNSSKIISNPISNSSKIISNPITNSPKIISNPISNSSKIINNPISNSTKIISNPISNSTKIISNPISNSTKIISNPTSSATVCGPNSTKKMRSLLSNAIFHNITSNPISSVNISRPTTTTIINCPISSETNRPSTSVKRSLHPSSQKTTIPVLNPDQLLAIKNFGLFLYDEIGRSQFLSIILRLESCETAPSNDETFNQFKILTMNLLSRSPETTLPVFNPNQLSAIKSYGLFLYAEIGRSQFLISISRLESSQTAPSNDETFNQFKVLTLNLLKTLNGTKEAPKVSPESINVTVEDVANLLTGSGEKTSTTLDHCIGNTDFTREVKRELEKKEWEEKLERKAERQEEKRANAAEMHGISERKRKQSEDDNELAKKEKTNLGPGETIEKHKTYIMMRGESESEAPKERINRRLYDPALLMRAVECVQTKNYSERRAAMEFKIPRSTLKDRLLGKFPTVRTPQCYLSWKEEKELMDYIMFNSKSGFSMTYSDIKTKAKEIVVQRQDSDKEVHLPTSVWLKNFVKRHPEVKKLRHGTPEAIDSTTCDETEKVKTPENIGLKTCDESEEDDIGVPTTSTKTMKSPVSTATFRNPNFTMSGKKSSKPKLPKGKCTSIRKIRDPALIMQAIESIKTEKYTIQQAAKVFKIHDATLRDKLLGRSPIVSKQRYLSWEEEKQLADYIVFMSKSGFYPTRYDIRAKAKDIVVQRQESDKEINLPSYVWLYAFFRRHPELKNLKDGIPEAIDSTTCCETDIDKIPDNICSKTCDEVEEDEISIATTSAKTEKMYPSTLDQILIQFSSAESVNTETLFPSMLEESVIAFNSAESISQSNTKENNQAFAANETKRPSKLNETKHTSTANETNRLSSVNETSQPSTASATICSLMSTATIQTPTSNKNVCLFSPASTRCPSKITSCPISTATVSHPISTKKLRSLLQTFSNPTSTNITSNPISSVNIPHPLTTIIKNPTSSVILHPSTSVKRSLPLSSPETTLPALNPNQLTTIKNFGLFLYDEMGRNQFLRSTFLLESSQTAPSNDETFNQFKVLTMNLLESLSGASEVPKVSPDSVNVTVEDVANLLTFATKKKDKVTTEKASTTLDNCIANKEFTKAVKIELERREEEEKLERKAERQERKRADAAEMIGMIERKTKQSEDDKELVKKIRAITNIGPEKIIELVWE